MAWLFKKEKVIDLTKDEIKVPASVRERLEGEYKDLTGNSSAGNSDADSGSALGFLGNMAISSESSKSLISNSGDISFQHLKTKLDDAEYKIESLRRKIDAIFDRVDLTEKKINRLEGR